MVFQPGSQITCCPCKEPVNWSGGHRGWRFLGEDMCVNAFREMTTVPKKQMLKYLPLSQ